MEVLDRKSDCVKLENGEWLAPQRVEHALESCGSVRACVVIARAGWAAPVAVVVTEASLEEVEEEARGCTLAPWEVPRFVLRREPFDEKECSAHGKVRRHVVAATSEKKYSASSQKCSFLPDISDARDSATSPNTSTPSLNRNVGSASARSRIAARRFPLPRRRLPTKRASERTPLSASKRDYGTRIKRATRAPAARASSGRRSSRATR